MFFLKSSSTLSPSLQRFLTYMLAHKGASHLWSNVSTQLTLAWLATAAAVTAKANGGRKSRMRAEAELAAAYLLAVFCGGMAFRAALPSEAGDVGLVGASAGVFGLAGVCAVGGAADAVTAALRRWTRRARYAELTAANAEEGEAAAATTTTTTTTTATTTKWILLLAARLAAAGVVVGFDAFELASSLPTEVAAVHLAGFAAGAAAAAAAVAWRAAVAATARCVCQGDKNEEEEEDKVKVVGV